jgi:hypothetical protein
MDVTGSGTTVSNNIIKIGEVQSSTVAGFIRLNTATGKVTFSGNELRMATPGTFPANTGINGLLTQGLGEYEITGNRFAVSGGPTQDADAVGITGGTVVFDGNVVNGDIMGGVTAYDNFGSVEITNNEISNYTAQLAGIRVVGCCGFDASSGFVKIANNKVGSTVSGTTGIGIKDVPAVNILSLSNNDLSGNAVAINHTGTGTLIATCNWFGSDDAQTVASKINGDVTFIPYLVDGTDNSDEFGFQPKENVCIGGYFVQNVTQDKWYPSIQSAVNAANPNDVIAAGSGVYNETVNIEKGIDLRGSNYGVKGDVMRNIESVITGGIVMNGVSGVKVDGFNIKGNNAPGSRGILIGNTNSVPGPIELNNNIIEDWTTGISLAGGATYPWVIGVTVNGNLIQNNTAGIGSTENVEGLTVTDNTFRYNSEGIGLGSGLTGFVLSGNIFETNNAVYLATYDANLIPPFSTIFNNNSFSRAVGVNDVGNPAYIFEAIYPNINDGIQSANSEATIEIAKGVYSENLIINKLLTLDGAGSDSTIVTSAAANMPVFTITASGLNAAKRIILKEVGITGASGGTGNPNSGISINGAGSFAHYTFENLAVYNNSGYGIAFNGSSLSTTFSDIKVLNSSISNNAVGLRFGSSLTFNGVEIKGSTFTSNTTQGIGINSSISGPGSFSGTNLTIEDCIFNGNGSNSFAGSQLGFGDISVTGFNGNATIKNVVVNGRPADSAAHLGVQIRGQASSGTNTPPYFAAGTVSIENLTINGAYRRPSLAASLPGAHGYAFYLQNYSDVSKVNMSGVVINNTDAGYGLGTSEWQVP